MSDKPTNNDNIKNALESLENTTEAPSNDGVTGVEVLKGDMVMYEDGDFEDYNAEKQAESNKDDKSNKADESDKDNESNKDDKHGMTIANIYQWASKLKDDFISDKEGKSDSKDKETSSKSDQDDKHSATISNIYQWASKLKDDFTSEAFSMTHEVSEKAVAMMLNRLLDAAEAELKTFDENAEDSKEPVPNATEERSKITDKKDKYQSMLEQLRS